MVLKYKVEMYKRSLRMLSMLSGGENSGLSSIDVSIFDLLTSICNISISIFHGAKVRWCPVTELSIFDLSIDRPPNLSRAIYNVVE